MLSVLVAYDLPRCRVGSKTLNRPPVIAHAVQRLYAGGRHQKALPQAKDLSVKRAFEEVARGWLVLAEQMEWIDRQKSRVHEALGIARGSAIVRLGGNKGRIVKLHMPQASPNALR